MTTCIIAIVAFREHHSFNGFKHMFIPVFGLLANLGCMLFYLIGPFMVSGMSWNEPYIALAVAAAWGIYGLVYFKRRSARVGRPVFLTEKPAYRALTEERRHAYHNPAILGVAGFVFMRLGRNSRRPTSQDWCNLDSGLIIQANALSSRSIALGYATQMKVKCHQLSSAGTGSRS